MASFGGYIKVKLPLSYYDQDEETPTDESENIIVVDGDDFGLEESRPESEQTFGQLFVAEVYDNNGNYVDRIIARVSIDKSQTLANSIPRISLEEGVVEIIDNSLEFISPDFEDQDLDDFLDN